MEEIAIVNIELIHPDSTGISEAHDNSTTTPILADITFANGTIVRGVDPTTLHQRQDHAVWMALRQAMNVTASELSAIVGNSVFTTRERLLQKKSGVPATSFSTTSSPPMNRQALEWGLKMEPKALKQYCEATGNQVQETGLHIRQFFADEESGGSSTTRSLPSMVLVGASPDGLVIDAKDQTRGVLEIKSLWGRRHKKELPQFKHCPQRFWDQIQGQMAVCNVEWCDLIIYIPPNTPQTKQKQKRGGGGPGKNYCILRIARDRSYWNEKLFPAIQSFCKEMEELRATPRGITTDSPTVDDNMDSDMSIQD